MPKRAKIEDVDLEDEEEDEEDLNSIASDDSIFDREQDDDEEDHDEEADFQHQTDEENDEDHSLIDELIEEEEDEHVLESRLLTTVGKRQSQRVRKIEVVRCDSDESEDEEEKPKPKKQTKKAPAKPTENGITKQTKTVKTSTLSEADIKRLITQLFNFKNRLNNIRKDFVNIKVKAAAH